jgi:hypothetical protein
VNLLAIAPWKERATRDTAGSQLDLSDLSGASAMLESNNGIEHRK